MKLKDYQLDTAARLVASGYPSGSIAQTVGCSTGDLKKLIEGNSATFTGMLEGYRMEFNRISREHVERLEGFLPAAYDAYDMALQGTDIRVASEKAEKIFEANFGPMGHHKAPPKVEPPTLIQISVKEQNFISQTFEGIQKSLKKFEEAETVTFRTHVRTGEEALPTPEAAVRVVDVTSDTVDELDLVELDES